MVVHPGSIDLDSLTFSMLESIVEQYGYSLGDLIYYRDPNKDLVVDLHLVSSNYNVDYMSSVHVENHAVEQYIVSFQDDRGGDGEDVEDDEEEEDVGGRVTLKDDKISDDDDVFEDNYNVNRAGPSTYKCVEDDGENGMRMGMRMGMCMGMGMGMGMRMGMGMGMEMGTRMGMGLRVLELRVGVCHLHLTTACSHLKMLRWMTMILKWVEVTSFCHHLLVMKRMVGFHLILVRSSM
jgi:hypothetical protein